MTSRKNQKTVKSVVKAVKNPKKGRGSSKEKLANTPEMMITALASEASIKKVAQIFKVGTPESTKLAIKQSEERSRLAAYYTTKSTFKSFVQWRYLMGYNSNRAAAAAIVSAFLVDKLPTTISYDEFKTKSEVFKRSGKNGVTDEGVLNGEKRKQQTQFDFSGRAYDAFWKKVSYYCNVIAPVKMCEGTFISECIDLAMREFKPNKSIDSTVLEESYDAFENFVGFDPANEKARKSRIHVEPLDCHVVQVKHDTRVKRLAKKSAKLGRKIEKRMHKILKSKQGINLKPNQMFTADDLLRMAMLQNAFEANERKM